MNHKPAITYMLRSVLCLLVCQFLFLCPSFSQRSYSPPVNPGDTMKIIVEERFENNIYAWPVGTNSDGQFQFIKGQNGYTYSIYNPNQDRSLVGLNKGIEWGPKTDFIIVAKFDLWKTLSEGAGNGGGGFAWTAGAPFRDMQLLYFNYNKPSYKFAQWNEKGEYKLLFEKELASKNNNITIEIHRKKDTLSFYSVINDSLILLFTTPAQSVVPFNKMGFYIDGKMHMTARELKVKASLTPEEKLIAFQNRAEDFLKWEAVAESKGKELAKLVNKKNIDYKEKAKINSVQNELSRAYSEMATIKWLDNDQQSAIGFYALASELGYERSGFYLGRLYEIKYRESQLQSDKDFALTFYWKAAKKERTDLGFPPALKAYYSLKYPFITDYSFVSPYWQNENMVPKTKEEYEQSQVFRAEQHKRSRELAEKFAKRPRLLVRSVVINNYSSDSTQSYVTTSTSQYPKILLKKIPFDELKYGDYYYDNTEKDFIPFTMSYDEAVKLKNRLAMAIRNEDYNVSFDFMDKPGCPVCFGEGFVKTSSGVYAYQVATGRYTETRSSTIVGQTESVTRTPVYEMHTVQAGPPKYELCKACNGTGGRQREKIIQVTVDGVRVK